MAQLDDIKTRAIELQGKVDALRRDIGAAALERAQGKDGTDKRITQLTAELRTTEDLLAAERLALEHAGNFAAEAATRERHKAARKGMDDLASMLDRRRELAAKVDAAALALAGALRELRSNCKASRDLAANVGKAAFQGTPGRMASDRMAAMVGAVGHTEGAFLTACATMICQLFELHTGEGQELYRATLQAMGSGAGHYTDQSRVLTHAAAAERTASDLPSALVHVKNALAAEAADLGPEPAQPEGLLA